MYDEQPGSEPNRAARCNQSKRKTAVTYEPKGPQKFAVTVSYNNRIIEIDRSAHDPGSNQGESFYHYSESLYHYS